MKDIEALITHLVKIPGNQLKEKMARDADINRILREILRQHEPRLLIFLTSIAYCGKNLVSVCP